MGALFCCRESYSVIIFFCNFTVLSFLLGYSDTRPGIGLPYFVCSWGYSISFAFGESHPCIFDLLIAAFPCYFPSAFVDGQCPCVSSFVDSTSPAHPGHYSSRILCRNSLSTLTGMAARYRATVAVRFVASPSLARL
jgi:hypothetical protein